MIKKRIAISRIIATIRSFEKGLPSASFSEKFPVLSAISEIVAESADSGASVPASEVESQRYALYSFIISLSDISASPY